MKPRVRRTLLATTLLASAALSTVSTPARAQASAQDSAVAQSLYDQGRKLAAQNNYAEACPKLEESERLDPTAVTQFWLADCYEHAGRTASAWSSFLDLAATARRTGGPKAEEREKVAKDRANAIAPKLTQLAISVPDAVKVPGLVIKRDGEAVHSGQWGSPVPVDPGNHTIEASAPGKLTWTKTEDVEGVGQTVTIQVDPLGDTPIQVTAPAQGGAQSPGAQHEVVNVPPKAEPARSSPLKTVGLVVGAVGIVGLGVGGVFGGLAISKNSSANSGHCGTAFGGTDNCDATGLSLRHDAVHFGNVSTISFIAGGVLAVGGATLWLFAPSSSVRAGATVGNGGPGLTVHGTF
jgi:hypothetical protein